MSKRLDQSELEARRIEAGKLLQRGVRPAEVARRLKVSRTSVGRWQQMLTSGGRRSLRGAPRTGRPPLLDANDQKRLIASLKAGALAGLPVARHLQIELASAGQDSLAAVTVPMIAWFADHLVCAFRSQVLVHLGV